MKRYKYRIAIVSSYCGVFRALQSGSGQGLGEHLVKWNGGKDPV
jgi:hypothetical protein